MCTIKYTYINKIGTYFLLTTYSSKIHFLYCATIIYKQYSIFTMAFQEAYSLKHHKHTVTVYLCAQLYEFTDTFVSHAHTECSQFLSFRIIFDGCELAYHDHGALLSREFVVKPEASGCGTYTLKFDSTFAIEVECEMLYWPSDVSVYRDSRSTIYVCRTLFRFQRYPHNV